MAADAGKNRGLDTHPRGPQGKRSKRKERCFNPDDASGLARAPVSHPSAALKPQGSFPVYTSGGKVYAGTTVAAASASTSE